MHIMISSQAAAEPPAIRPSTSQGSEASEGSAHSAGSNASEVSGVSDRSNFSDMEDDKGKRRRGLQKNGSQFIPFIHLFIYLFAIVILLFCYFLIYYSWYCYFYCDMISVLLPHVFLDSEGLPHGPLRRKKKSEKKCKPPKDAPIALLLNETQPKKM